VETGKYGRGTGDGWLDPQPTRVPSGVWKSTRKILWNKVMKQYGIKQGEGREGGQEEREKLLPIPPLPHATFVSLKVSYKPF